MAKRLSQAETACPIVRALGAIGDWWSLLIVQDAFKGARRFDEFQSNLGLAKNILSARLKSLVAHGVFETAPAADENAHREYILTQKGRALLAVLFALRQLGEHFMFASSERHHPTLVDRERGRSDFRMFAAMMTRLMGWTISSSRNTTTKLGASEIPKTATESPSKIAKSAKNDALGVLLCKPAIPDLK